MKIWVACTAKNVTKTMCGAEHEEKTKRKENYFVINSNLHLLKNDNMKLSEHFTLEEMVRSATADRNHISNTPSQAEIEWLKYLCVNVLEPLRKHMERPITITSGYRCPKLNTLVGGVAKSQHQYGQAADIRILNKQDGDKIFAYLKTNKYVSKALYERSKSTGTRWIHVAVAAVPVRYFNSDYPAK